MESTTKRAEKKPKPSKGVSWLVRIFGGEFLLSKQMIPWYPYIAFVLLLMGILIVSEQRFQEKQQLLSKLENNYKIELSNLKDNNQFIPYEENQLLIHKMEERGYQLNEERTYTILVKKPIEEKKRFRFFKRKDRKNNNEPKHETQQTEE